MNISAGLGVAVREFPLTTGDADYMLYADARAIGVVEAKPKGHTLTGVETQSGKYLDGLPSGLPHHRLPLPFAYESAGEVTQFTNTLEADARSRTVFTVHRPAELIRLAKLDQQVRTRLQSMPPLDTGRLWRVQVESIQNLEQSLALNNPPEDQNGTAELICSPWTCLMAAIAVSASPISAMNFTASWREAMSIEGRAVTEGIFRTTFFVAPPRRFDAIPSFLRVL